MSSTQKVMFKKRTKNKGLRSKEADTDDQEQQDDQAQSTAKGIEELKELQRLKKRVNKGVNIADLLVAAPSVVKEETKAQPKYGLVTVKELKKSELDLGNTFSAETNRRDEDAEMTKYIEEELAKRKGAATASGDDADVFVPKTSEDIVFNVLPKHLIADNKQKSEEMLSSQMLSGIPEIDLGVDEKFRNIEATEEAKVKLMENKRKRNRDGPGDLIPTNIAVNFVQHNRYNVPESEPTLAMAQKKKPLPPKPTVAVVEEPVVVIGEEPRQGRFKNYQPHYGLKHPGREKATDDYHFDRFRKQFRKWLLLFRNVPIHFVKYFDNLKYDELKFMNKFNCSDFMWM